MFIDAAYLITDERCRPFENNAFVYVYVRSPEAVSIFVINGRRAGRYSHPWYGTVYLDDGRLTLTSARKIVFEKPIGRRCKFSGSTRRVG